MTRSTGRFPSAYRAACPSAEEFNRAEWLTCRTDVSIDRIATGFRQIGVIFAAFDNGDILQWIIHLE
jgi:hypothetical protein